MLWKILRMPSRNPRASAILSLVVGLPSALVGILYFIVAVVQSIGSAIGGGTTSGASAGQTALTGIAAGLASALFLALTVSAVRDTNWLQNWTPSPNGSLRHVIIRWTGPLFIVLSIFEVFAVVWLTLWFFQQMARTLQQ